MAAMNMNQEQFEQAIREEKPVLVDFWALYRNGKAVDSITAPGSKAEIDRFIQGALAK